MVLPAFELSVLRAADAGQVSEARATVRRHSGLSQVRHDWLLATILMAGSGRDQKEAAKLLGDLLDHPWARTEPETRAVVALDLAGYALKKVQKPLLARVEAATLELDEVHGSNPAVSEWTARVWVIIGHQRMQDGHLDEAISCYERTLADAHPDNWCTRFTAGCYMLHAYALKGIGRPDLLARAMSEVPLERRKAGWGVSAIALSKAYLSLAFGQVTQARVRVEDTRKKARAEGNPFNEALADLLLVQLAISSGDEPEAALLSRITDWGVQFAFVPFLADKLIKEGRKITCAIVS